jgi:hypothetical protein
VLQQTARAKRCAEAHPTKPLGAARIGTAARNISTAIPDGPLKIDEFFFGRGNFVSPARCANRKP